MATVQRPSGVRVRHTHAYVIREDRPAVRSLRRAALTDQGIHLVELRRLVAGATIAGASVAAREKVRRASDTTWLAYVLCGHSEARLARA